jgi:hypothetical protein
MTNLAYEVSINHHNDLGRCDGFAVIVYGQSPKEDAALIAAAPDLLAALQAVYDFWAGGDVPGEIDAAMQAAIRKATGEDCRRR